MCTRWSTHHVGHHANRSLTVGITKYFINNNESGLSPISFDEYKTALLSDRIKARRAFEKAWATRNFEIEMYWKRATYFWAFIASTFLGYFALLNSVNYTRLDQFNHAEVYFVICIGFVLSFAWTLTNIGSKAWQRHWEVHVDLLEDEFTGPLYKTVHPKLTYSVSKINEIVSATVTFTWLLLGAKFLLDQKLTAICPANVNWFVSFSTLGALLAIISML